MHWFEILFLMSTAIADDVERRNALGRKKNRAHLKKGECYYIPVVAGIAGYSLVKIILLSVWAIARSSVKEILTYLNSFSSNLNRLGCALQYQQKQVTLYTLY